MSKLHSRIASQPAAAAAAAGSFHPAGTADTPHADIPRAVIRYGNGMTGVEQVIFAPDGRAIPMLGPAGYGSAAVHGRP
jgi:hypothetical protein